MVRVNFENTLNDLIQFQAKMNKNGRHVITIHIHLMGGNCITMGNVARFQVKEMHGEDLCFIEYYNKDEEIRQIYLMVSSVIAVAALEKR